MLFWLAEYVMFFIGKFQRSKLYLWNTTEDFLHFYFPMFIGKLFI